MTKCTEAAAREAALVGALKTARAAFNSIEDKSPDSWWDRAAWMRKEVDDALADTSPAAAALLAQGEALRSIAKDDNWNSGGDWQGGEPPPWEIASKALKKE